MITNRSLQKWKLSQRANPQLQSDQNLIEPLIKALSPAVSPLSLAADEELVGISLEIWDVEVVDPLRGEIGVLVSFVDEFAAQGERGERKRFAVVRVRVEDGNGGAGGEVKVEGVVKSDFGCVRKGVSLTCSFFFRFLSPFFLFKHFVLIFFS